MACICQAPDLDEEWELAKQAQVGILLNAMTGGGISASPAVGHARNTIRLTVSAVQSYRRALERDRDAVDHRAPQLLYLVTNEWERCVTAAYRATRSAEVLRRRLGQWAPDDDVMRIDRSARLHPDAVVDLRRFRDHIEHIEERQGTQEEGGMAMLWSGELGLHFGDDHLPYDEPAEVVRRLVTLSVWLDRLNPGPGHPLNATGAQVNRDAAAEGPFRIV